MKKLLFIPDKVHDVLVEHKELTGRAISSMIQEALYKWLIHERLMIPKLVTLYYNKTTNKYFSEEEYNKMNGNGKTKIINAPPEGIKFCDGDKCELPPMTAPPGGSC